MACSALPAGVVLECDTLRFDVSRASAVFFGQGSAKTSTFCATVVLLDEGKSNTDEDQKKVDRGEKLLQRITTATYNAARNKTREIEGFPDFGPLVAELKALSGQGQLPTSSFKVTSLQPSGALIVKEPFFAQFQDSSEFHDAVSRHNEAYNPDNIRLTDRATNTSKTTIVIQPDEALTAEKIAALPDPSEPQTCPWKCETLFLCCAPNFVLGFLWPLRPMSTSSAPATAST